MRTPGDNRRGRRRTADVVGAAIASVVAVVWLVTGQAAAQVPVPPPETPTTLPAEVPDPAGAQPPAVDPTAPPSTSPDGTPAPAPTPEPLRTAPGPTTTTTTVAPGEPTGRLSVAGSGPGGSDAGKGSGSPAAPGVDLSEFSALRAAALGKGPRPMLPDGTFDPSLPFDPTGAAAQSGDEPRELGAEEDEQGQVRSLGAVAAGAMAAVLLLLVRWLLRQAEAPAP